MEPWQVGVSASHQIELVEPSPLMSEMADAHRVQQFLLPRSFPPIKGLEGAGQCRPAADVGGDYYDYFPMSDGSVGLAIGDVCGKGVPAALLMAMLQATLRGLVRSNVSSLPSLMSALNRLVYESIPDNRFATLFVGAYHSDSRELKYVNAGHLPPIVFRRTGALRLSDGGHAVGLFPKVHFQQSSVTLCDGDVVAFFTDGVTESANSSGIEFGEERLANAVRRNSALPAKDIVEHVFDSCLHFTSRAHQRDDMTLVILRAV
jgi:sigma-B regulation protein RsbU (phosphoserine phosphatase)